MSGALTVQAEKYLQRQKLGREEKICLLGQKMVQLQYRVVIGVYYSGADARTALLCD